MRKVIHWLAPSGRPACGTNVGNDTHADFDPKRATCKRCAKLAAQWLR